MRALLCAAIGVWLVVMPAAAPAVAEVRGLWVLRTSLQSKKSIESMVRAARTGGFNTLLIQVRGRGEAYYRSAIEPRASDLDGQPKEFDPLATTLALAHEAGLQVHAWINVDLISNAVTLPRSPAHVVFRHPEWLMVPRPLANGLRGVDPRSRRYVSELARWTRTVSTQVEGLYLSPIPAESRDYTTSVIAELTARYAIDGVHLDYARYPNESFDYSPLALREFRDTHAARVGPADRVRLDRAAASDASAWADAFPEAWAGFRRERLTALVRRVHDVVKNTRPAVVVSAAVGPNIDETFGHRFQDWRGWIAAGLLDAVCPMAYTPNLVDFSDTIARTTRAARPADVWAGIGAWQLPAAQAAAHVNAARKAGAAGVLIFSYDRLASKSGPARYFGELRPTLIGPLRHGAF